MSNPNPAPSGPPLRALAMVLIALAIVFGGLGALSWSSNSDLDNESLGATANESIAAQPTIAASKVPAAGARPPATTDSAAALSATPAGTTSAARSSTSRAQNSTSAASTTRRAGATTTPSAVGADVVGSIPVRVLNNSVVSGLAADTATELRGGGWRVTQTGNFTDRDLTESTVYYGNKAGAKEAATMIAEQLDATLAPATPEISASADGVTVVLTGD